VTDTDYKISSKYMEETFHYSTIMLAAASLWGNQNALTPMENCVPMCWILWIADNRIRKAAKMTGTSCPCWLGNMLYNCTVNRHKSEGTGSAIYWMGLARDSTRGSGWVWLAARRLTSNLDRGAKWGLLRTEAWICPWSVPVHYNHLESAAERWRGKHCKRHFVCLPAVIAATNDPETWETLTIGILA